jgi:hypothetical protein
MPKRSLKLLIALVFIWIVGWVYDLLPPKAAKKVSRLCDRASKKVWDLYQDMYRKILEEDRPRGNERAKRQPRRSVKRRPEGTATPGKDKANSGI